MSYSFSVTASTKAEAKEKLAEQFANVLLSQPVHAADMSAAQSAAEAFVEILSDPADDQQISVSVHGSLSWRGEGDFQGANLGIGAHLAAKA